MEKTIVISGTGSFAPPEVISNDELVASFNAYVHDYQQRHATEIAAGKLPALQTSSAEFIVKASGIQRRHVIDKKNILDIHYMKPQFTHRPNEAMSFQCEFALSAAKQALLAANKKPEDIDMIIVSCGNTQRPYPAIAIELQQILGCKGYGFDMRVACSSATFGLQTAYNAIMANNAKTVLMVSPEVATPQLNFRDRDSHFIFGDAAVAAVIENIDTCSVEHPYHIRQVKLLTQFSNNIRCNEGFFNRVEIDRLTEDENLFKQQGRTVFKEVVPWVVKFIQQHLTEQQLTVADIKRFWLHQANINMNQLIMEKLLGRAATFSEAPLILDEYANTGSVGSLLAFHFHQHDLLPGDLGLLCSFGAGYSIGNLILQRL